MCKRILLGFVVIVFVFGITGCLLNVVEEEQEEEMQLVFHDDFSDAEWQDHWYFSQTHPHYGLGDYGLGYDVARLGYCPDEDGEVGTISNGYIIIKEGEDIKEDFIDFKMTVRAKSISSTRHLLLVIRTTGDLNEIGHSSQSTGIGIYFHSDGTCKVWHDADHGPYDTGVTATDWNEYTVQTVDNKVHVLINDAPIFTYEIDSAERMGPGRIGILGQNGPVYVDWVKVWE